MLQAKAHSVRDMRNRDSKVVIIVGGGWPTRGDESAFRRADTAMRQRISTIEGAIINTRVGSIGMVERPAAFYAGL
jgi:hypothetical protein